MTAYVYGGFNPRRLGGRRVEDQLYPIVDRHPPRVLALVLSILVLSATDAALTIHLMQHGAIEANPFMALLIEHDVHLFANVKLGLTAVGLLMLAACSPMRLMRTIKGESVLYGLLACYVALIGYELHLLTRV